MGPDPPTVGFTLSGDQRKQRRAEAQNKTKDLQDRVDDVWKTQQDAAAKIALDMKVPESRVKLMLGVKGSEGKNKRAVNSYNGWISLEIEKRNSELEPGETKWNATTVKEEFGDIYKNATEAEKDEHRHRAQELHDKHGDSSRKTGKKAVSDVRETWKHLVDTANHLEERTGHQITMISTKTDPLSYANPSFHIPHRVASFMDTTLKMNPNEVTHLMEAYAILGPEGVTRNAKTMHDATKKEIVSAIVRNLRSVSGNRKALMCYEGFHHGILVKLGVDIFGWPPSVRFINPTKMRRDEIKAVHAALFSAPPTLMFIKLTKSEVAAKSLEYGRQQSSLEVSLDGLPSISQSSALIGAPQRDNDVDVSTAAPPVPTTHALARLYHLTSTTHSSPGLSTPLLQVTSLAQAITPTPVSGVAALHPTPLHPLPPTSVARTPTPPPLPTGVDSPMTMEAVLLPAPTTKRKKTLPSDSSDQPPRKQRKTGTAAAAAVEASRENDVPVGATGTEDGPATQKTRTSGRASKPKNMYPMSILEKASLANI